MYTRSAEGSSASLKAPPSPATTLVRDDKRRDFCRSPPPVAAGYILVPVVVLSFSGCWFDRVGVRTHTRRMNPTSSRATVDQELKQLERRLEELVALVSQLQEENRALRQRQDSMMTERATLLQKNEQVRARVEAMIGRLKAMEHNA